MKREFETRGYYTEGNTVRKMQPIPRPDYREEQKRREEEEKERLRKKRNRRNQEKALQTNKSYVVFLTMGVLIFGLFSGVYIKIQSDITARMKTISRLESQVSDLRAENDDAFKRISTAIDLEAVKNTAIHDLGMFYASESQIIYYTIENDDYMNQYIEIPEE